jgi:hypothetical protein
MPEERGGTARPKGKALTAQCNLRSMSPHWDSFMWTTISGFGIDRTTWERLRQALLRPSVLSTVPRVYVGQIGGQGGTVDLGGIA